METAEIRFYEKPKLSKPVLIQGLPGVGNVGRAVAGYLISQWKAKLIAEIISPELVPLVSINNSSEIQSVGMKLYYARKSKRDFLILTGDSQAVSNTGHYKLSWEIVKLTKQMGVEFIITIGGFVHEKTKSPVIGAVTDKAIKEAFKGTGIVFSGNNVVATIVGEAGLVLSLAKHHGMDGICLMSKVIPHPGIVTDPKAAREVLKVLQKYLSIRINMKEMEKSVDEMEKVIGKVMEITSQMPKIKNKEGYIG